MKLSAAARMADTVTALDAYSGASPFLCQLAPLELFRVEGTKIKIRQLSTGPDVTIPARGVIKIDGEEFLIGHPSLDYWRGTVIRKNYVTQGVDGLASMLSIEAALSGATGTQAYASAEFSRYLPDGADSSKFPPQYEVFVAEGESVPADSLIHLGSVWYLVKESYLAASGLRVALANVLSSPVFETVTFGSATYDPITDSSTVSSSTHPALRVKWTEHYTYLSIGTETYERGDQQVFLLKTATPKASDRLTMSDGVWRILSVQDEGARWSCHVRRA